MLLYQDSTRKVLSLTAILTIYLIEMHFNTFANRADQNQTTIVRAVGSGSTMFAYGNMIRNYPTLVNLTSNLCKLENLFM